MNIKAVFIRASAALCVLFAFICFFELEAQQLSINPPSDCSGKRTVAMTEGPFYKPDSPERASLVEPGIPGERVVIAGYVFDTTCKPVTGAILDFWQADGRGAYDNTGYRLRGRQATDSNGLYTLATVVPGDYPGRTPHIHVKVITPSGRSLTTQLYFPGKAQNASDPVFDQSLVVTLDQGGLKAYFNFVVQR